MSRNRPLFFICAAGTIVAILTYAAITNVAFAYGKPMNPDKVIYQNNTVTNNRNQDQRQGQEQGQSQQAASESNSTAFGGSAGATAESAAVNEGVTMTQNYESGPADLVLVPNNNTENCLRVFGFSGGNRDGSAMFGIPFRSARCDYENAADDAFAAGERELGWFWKCHNKSLYKPFRDQGESKDKAIEDCVARMVGPITLRREYNAVKDQLDFIENERKIERERFQQERDRIQADCAESNERVLEACVGK